MWLYIEWIDGKSQEFPVKEDVIFNHKLGYVSRGKHDSLMYVEDKIINLDSVRYMEIIREENDDGEEIR